MYRSRVFCILWSGSWWGGVEEALMPQHNEKLSGSRLNLVKNCRVPLQHQASTTSNTEMLTIHTVTKFRILKSQHFLIPVDPYIPKLDDNPSPLVIASKMIKHLSRKLTL